MSSNSIKYIFNFVVEAFPVPTLKTTQFNVTKLHMKILFLKFKIPVKFVHQGRYTGPEEHAVEEKENFLD